MQLSDEQVGSLEKLSILLLDWNKKINLISRRDEENIWTSHILHCLTPLFKVDLPLGARILDLGTGGGLPGIPLKIARPDLALTLIDSTQKKINVVKSLIEELGLKQIDALWGRAEEIGTSKDHARRYDVVIARAVASLKDLVQWSEPFLKNSAASLTTNADAVEPQARVQIRKPTLIALKGGDLEGEIGQIRTHRNVESITVIDLTLNGSTQLEGADKKIVLVEIVRTPKQKAERT